MQHEDLIQIEETLDNAATALFDAINASQELREQYSQFSAHLNLAIHSASIAVQRKTKKEIILETAEYYGSDPSRRALSTSGARCRYLTSDGRRCAVGRCMVEGVKIFYYDNATCKDATRSQETAVCSVDQIYFIDALLLPEYRGHDSSFWNSLQDLHDTDSYYDKNGLSESGQHALDYLLKKYSEE
jgi:hypothetical protein